MSQFTVTLRPKQIENLLNDKKISISQTQLKKGGSIVVNVPDAKSYKKLLKTVNGQTKNYTGVIANHIDGGKLTLKSLGKKINKFLHSKTAKSIGKTLGHVAVETGANYAEANGYDPNLIRAVGHNAIEGNTDNLHKIQNHYETKLKNELANQYGQDFSGAMNDYHTASNYRNNYDMSQFDGSGLRKKKRGGNVNLLKNIGKTALKSVGHVGVAVATQPMGLIGSTIAQDQINPIVDRQINGLGMETIHTHTANNATPILNNVGGSLERRVRNLENIVRGGSFQTHSGGSFAGHGLLFFK